MSVRILSISEMEARDLVTPNFGKGITVASGFDLGAKSPLDSRLTVKTLEERNAHVTSNRAYEGMLVYVEADQKTYQLVNNDWKEFGFNQADFEGSLQDSIVDNLASTETNKALSANQGKVIKGLIDALQLEVNGLDAALEQEIEDRQALALKVDGLESALSELTLRVEANEGKLVGITGTVTGAIDTAKAEAVEAAKGYTDEQILAQGVKITAVEGRLDVVEPKVTANEEKITAVEASIKALEQKDESLKGEIDAAVLRITTNEGSIETINGKVEALQTAADGVDAKIATAKSEAISTANEYTDAEIVKIDTAYKAADVQVLTDAKQYADEKDAENLNAAKQHAQQLVDGLKTNLTTPEPGAEINAKLGNLVVSGDLEVKGAVKSVERTELHVEDTMIELNSTGADVTTSDVHLGIRANLGEGSSSELVYCPDTQKWVIIDNHPSVLARNHGDAKVSTLAVAEEVQASNEELQGKITAVEGRLDVVEPKVTAVEGRLDTVEEDIAALKAVESVTDVIAVPGESMSLTKTPFGEKVELFINGLLYTEGFTVSGNTITWTGGFELDSDDKVIAKYVVK